MRSDLLRGETRLVAVEDRERRLGFVKGVKDAGVAGHAASVTGRPLPETGWLVCIPATMEHVPWERWRRADLFVVRRFEDDNALRLEQPGRYMVGWVDQGFVHLCVGFLFADVREARLAAVMSARQEGSGMVFDLEAGEQRYV
jgi:hypothetical protein